MQEPSEIEVEALTCWASWLVLVNQLINIHWQVVCSVGEFVALGHDLKVDL